MRTKTDMEVGRGRGNGMYLVVELPELDVGTSEEVSGTVGTGLAICVAVALAVGAPEGPVPATSVGAGKALTNPPRTPKIKIKPSKPLIIFTYPS